MGNGTGWRGAGDTAADKARRALGRWARVLVTCAFLGAVGLAAVADDDPLDLGFLLIFVVVAVVSIAREVERARRRGGAGAEEGDGAGDGSFGWGWDDGDGGDGGGNGGE